MNAFRYLLARPDGDGLSTEKALALVRVGLWLAVAFEALPATFTVERIEQLAPQVVTVWTVGAIILERALAAVAAHRARHRRGVAER